MSITETIYVITHNIISEVTSFTAGKRRVVVVPLSVELHVRLQLVLEGEPGVAPRTDEGPRRRVRHQMLKRNKSKPC